MVKFPLCLAEGGKTKLIDCGWLDHPGMREVQLLIPVVVKTSKPRDVSARSLEERKGLSVELVVKIVISVELLVVTNLVIDAARELVIVLPRRGDGFVLGPIQVRQGHKLVHQILRRRIKTRRRDVVVREDGRVGCAGSDRRPTACGHRSGAPRARVQQSGHCAVGVVQCSCERRSGGKIAAPLGGGGHRKCGRGSSLPDSVSLIRAKEEGLILPDGSAQSAAKLILLEVRYCGVKETTRVEHIVAKELIQVTVQGVGAGLRYHVHHGA